jgi:hypothetical protein
VTTLAAAVPLFGDLEAEPTLDAVVVRAWEGMAQHRVVECPVCRGEMAPHYGAQARPVEGRCASCGATVK